MGPLQLGKLFVSICITTEITFFSIADLWVMKSYSFSLCHYLTVVFSIGLDTCLAIQQTLYEGTRDSKYRPSILLERMVDAQWYGKKNGKGFYEYN